MVGPQPAKLQQLPCYHPVSCLLEPQPFAKSMSCWSHGTCLDVRQEGVPHGQQMLAGTQRRTSLSSRDPFTYRMSQMRCGLCHSTAALQAELSLAVIRYCGRVDAEKWRADCHGSSSGRFCCRRGPTELSRSGMTTRTVRLTEPPYRPLMLVECKPPLFKARQAGSLPNELGKGST